MVDAGGVYDAEVVVKVAPPTSEEIGRLRSDSVLIGFLQPLTTGEAIRAIAQTGATSFAMEAIPRISRAQSMDALELAGQHRRLQGGADRRDRDRSLLPDADDRGRDDPPRHRARARRRRRRAAGDRHGPAARRRGAGLRRARGGQGAGRVARRALPRVRPGRRPGGRRRLRQGAHPRAAGPPAGADGRGDREGRRGDHDRARPRPARADPGHRGGRQADEARLGDRRPGRRGGRQLRAFRARRDRGPPRREDPRAAERARARWPSTPRSSTRATSSRCSG